MKISLKQKTKLKRTLSSLLLISVLVYLGFGAMLNIYQYSFIYFPTEEITDNTYHYTTLRSDNETLKLWVINPHQKEAIIYFGGNAANAYNAIAHIEAISTSKTSYIVNYRGYGGSTGLPGERGITIDALNIYDFIQDHHDSISVIGRSLGAGVATYLASNRKLKKLVLITPFDSLESVAQERYPMFPISYLLIDKYDSIGQVGDIRESTLILIADTDNVIPTKHSYKLANAFKPEQLTVITLPDTNHHTISQHPRYLNIIADFLR